MSKNKTVAFTGHRHLDTDLTALSRRIEEVVNYLHLKGYKYFMFGMANGFDLLAAETVLQQQVLFPQIELVTVVPFPGQARYFSPQDKERYYSAKIKASQEVVISRHYFQGCFHRRNDYLLNHASRLVAWFDDRPCGGTFYTVSNALKRGIPVINLGQREELMFCLLGNGVSVADRSREQHGDYKTVAHISYERQVKYYDERMSITAVAQIERFARFDNMHPAAQPNLHALRPLHD